VNFVLNNGGGNIDFDCGLAPHTIVITATLQITTGVGFDGGTLGDITLSGGDVRPVFNVPLGGDLGLEDMVVAHGVIADGAGGCIFSFASVVFIQRSLIHSCRAGPPVQSASVAPAVVEGSSSEGGAIYSGGVGSLIIIDSEVLSSTADLGGGIRSLGYAQITGSRLAGNHGVSFGGAVQAFGTLMIANSVFEHNTSNHGGGIWTAVGSHASVVNTTIYSNTSGFDGGGIESRGLLTVTHSQILDNVADSAGGGLNAFDGRASLAQSVVAGNRTQGEGGGVFSSFALVLTDTQVLSNTSANSGGGVSAADVTASGSLFQNNHCTDTGCLGGGLSGFALVLTNTQITGNSSQGFGGGASASADAILHGVLVHENECLAGNCLGGGLFVSGMLSGSLAVFSDNTSRYDGGGAYASGPARLLGGRFQGNACTVTGCYGGGLSASALVITGTEFVSNTASSRGGGVYAGNIVALAALFQGNACQTGGCLGGGLTAGGSLVLTDTRLIQNTSAGLGGAVYAGGANPSRLVNALFARNSAATGGAALYAAGAGGATLLHVTIAGPGATGAPALHVSAGALGVTNTIIGSYTVGISRTGGVAFEDYNLFFNVPTPTSGSVASGGHSFAGDPVFAGPAQDDYHLRANSNAINGGVNAGVFSDIDGDLRPVNAGFDIGFDEFIQRLLYLSVILR
jgi:predicted outer membrane repeat protein